MGVTYLGNSNSMDSGHVRDSPLTSTFSLPLLIIPSLICLCVCWWCAFILFKCIRVAWIILGKKKKCTQITRFLHTGQICALFIWTVWVFLNGISRNTAYTLWKLYSIHLWQVEFITFNFMRLFITFQCIHLEQVKRKAANFHSLPDSLWCAQTLQMLVYRNEEQYELHKFPVAYGYYCQSYLLINFMVGLVWIPYNNCVLLKQWRIKWLRFEGYCLYMVTIYEEVKSWLNEDHLTQNT